MDLENYAPLWVTVSCLLIDARGNFNPICGGLDAYTQWTMTAGSRAGSALPIKLGARGVGRALGIDASALSPISGFSLLEPFTTDEAFCSKAMRSIVTAQPRGEQSKRFAADYDIELDPWEGAGLALGNRDEDLFAGKTFCDAGNRGTLAGEEEGVGVYRSLGMFPLCPYSEATLLGPWYSNVPLGGVGFVLSTPIIGLEDLVGPAGSTLVWGDGECVRDAFIVSLQRAADHKDVGTGLDELQDGAEEVEVEYFDDSSRPQTYALNPFSTWVRDGVSTAARRGQRSCMHRGAAVTP